MKLLLATVLVLSVVSCAELCTEGERNAKECLFIYDPVCAIQFKDNVFSRVTKINRCVACSDKANFLVVDGICEDIPEQAGFCYLRKPDGRACPLYVKPACGYLKPSIKCLSPPCTVPIALNCGSYCHRQDIRYYLPGACPTINP